MPQLRATEHDNITLIDSMPIEACRYSRAKSCKILMDDEQNAPTFGFWQHNSNTILAINFTVSVLLMV